MKDALIIDDETYFFVLMKSYLRKKNFTVEYRRNITDGVKLIQLKRPELIIVSIEITSELRDRLNNVVNSMDNYAPSIFFTNSDSLSDMLPADDRGTLLDEIKKLVRWIRDKFNS